jgi:dihydroorotase
LPAGRQARASPPGTARRRHQRRRRFFLGTDSAPHVDPLKECGCGCAGIYTSVNTMSCLAHVFEQENALDKLEAFASLNGPAWYGLPMNEERITLLKRPSLCHFQPRSRPVPVR